MKLLIMTMLILGTTVGSVYAKDCVTVYDYGDDQFKCVSQEQKYDTDVKIDKKRYGDNKERLLKKVRELKKRQ